MEPPHPHEELFTYARSLFVSVSAPVPRELLRHRADFDNALSQVVALARRYLATELESDRRALQMALTAAETPTVSSWRESLHAHSPSRERTRSRATASWAVDVIEGRHGCLSSRAESAERTGER